MMAPIIQLLSEDWKTDKQIHIIMETVSQAIAGLAIYFTDVV